MEHAANRQDTIKLLIADDERLFRQSLRKLLDSEREFDVVAHRLLTEYKVKCTFEHVSVNTARWIECDDPRMLDQFKTKAAANLAYDHAGELVYIAPTRVNLELTQEKWPDVKFMATREHVSA